MTTQKHLKQSLLAPDPDIPLDLNTAIRAVFTRAGYAWRINYQQANQP